MKIVWSDTTRIDGCYDGYIESPTELEPLMAVKQLSDQEIASEPDYLNNLKVGGAWLLSLTEMHQLVQYKVALHGLPDWLIIK